MSYSDMFVFDGSSCSVYQNSSPEEILPPETDLFFFGDQHSALENLFQATTTTNQPNPQQQQQQIDASDCLAVKTERCHVGFEFDVDDDDDAFRFFGDSFCTDASPQGCGGGFENVAKLIQRSLSSNSFAQNLYSSSSSSSSFSSGFLFSSQSQSQVFQAQPLCSSDNGFLRRVCSTGDLQSFGTARATITESSLMEETNFKVGKYSAEERKERISKYRAKRTLRNFNKTIKYACRKTLADNRPRIRGRFARNDEPDGFDVPKAPSSSSSRPDGDGDDDDDFWLEGLHEEEEGIDQTVRGQFVNSYGPTQFQYYGF